MSATLLPRDRLRRALSLPPDELLRVVAGKIARTATRATGRRRDRRVSTYVASPGALRRRIRDLDETALPAADEGLLRAAARRAAANRLDLLGSGWVSLGHGVARAGFGGVRFPAGPGVVADADGIWLAGQVTPANLPTARAAWRLVEPPYDPIDWQADVRSGYRWPALAWCHDVPIAPARGADIKLPWELGRMQHVALLALAHRLARRDGADAEATGCVRAFRNQVLDFIATNPPRFGVQWVSAMEVALRGASWAVALDLFRDAGEAFDAAFLDMLSASLLAHARHVRGNLERSALGRANHYLCNIAGLAVIVASLPDTAEVQCLRAFAAAEVAGELAHQFLPDGGHFEVSTGYHRLCLEAMLFAGAADDAVLGRALGLADATTKPDGRAWQIGDADSGRFLKLCADLRAGADGPAELPIDHRHLVASGWDRAVRRALGGRDVVPMLPAAAPFGDWAALERDWVAATQDRRRETSVPLPAGAADDLACHAFPDFGAYVWRGPRLFVGFRCGRFGHDGSGAHAHNDQLAVELWVDGADVWADPGSYVYTALPDERDRYRSAAAHRVPRPVAAEPSPLDLGLFRLPDTAQARCLAFGPRGAAGAHSGYGFAVHRWLEIAADRIVVRDWVPAGADAPDRIDWLEPEAVPFSPCYGLR